MSASFVNSVSFYDFRFKRCFSYFFNIVPIMPVIAKEARAMEQDLIPRVLSAFRV